MRVVEVRGCDLRERRASMREQGRGEGRELHERARTHPGRAFGLDPRAPADLEKSCYGAIRQVVIFVVGFTVGGNDTTRTTVYTQRFRQVDIVGTAPDPVEVRSQDSTEGGLAIDIFDQAGARKQWMGWVSKEITMSERRDLQSTVRELVAIILDHFPP